MSRGIVAPRSTVLPLDVSAVLSSSVVCTVVSLSLSPRDASRVASRSAIGRLSVAASGLEECLHQGHEECVEENPDQVLDFEETDSESENECQIEDVAYQDTAR